MAIRKNPLAWLLALPGLFFILVGMYSFWLSLFDSEHLVYFGIGLICTSLGYIFAWKFLSTNAP